MSEFKTKGRKLSALELEILGPIEPQDLIAREEGGLPTSEAPTIAKLRGIHHEIAQLLAQGLSETEVSAITSYSLSRISILKRDPSFKDLVAFYQKQKTEQFADVQNVWPLCLSMPSGKSRSALPRNPTPSQPPSSSNFPRLPLTARV